MPKPDLAFQSAVKAGLEAIGPDGAVSTLYFMENNFGLRLPDFHSHPDLFCQSIRSIFLNGSAILLRSVQDKLRASHSAGELDLHYCAAFVECLDRAIKAVESGIE
jgi:hypothetical protein